MDDFKKDLCEKLWNENEAALRRLCFVKMQSHPDEIDDVISEVFLALCQNISKDNIPNKPKAWLYGTLNNIIKLRYRKLYALREKETSLSNKEYDLPFDNGGIEEEIGKMDINQIEDILKKYLNENEYQLIKSIHYDKLKIKEIAEMNNTTETAIRQKNYRICKKFRKAVKNSKKIF